MSSPLGGKRNVKIFLLYLMQNLNIPLDLATLTDIVMQTDYVMYLDFSECFHALIEDKLVSAVPKAAPGEEPRYIVTDRGRIVAEQLHTDLLPSILEESLRCALRYLDFRRLGIIPECHVRQLPDGSAAFDCSFRQGNKTLFETTINVDSVARARQMADNFQARPEAIYKGMISLLSGNVNYLFT